MYTAYALPHHTDSHISNNFGWIVKRLSCVFFSRWIVERLLHILLMRARWEWVWIMLSEMAKTITQFHIAWLYNKFKYYLLPHKILFRCTAKKISRRNETNFRFDALYDAGNPVPFDSKRCECVQELELKWQLSSLAIQNAIYLMQYDFAHELFPMHPGLSSLILFCYSSSGDAICSLIL